MAERKKILVIDDEMDLQSLICEELEARGYATISASDGKEGLEKVESQKPDAIFTDFKMPTMNGLEFLEVLRQKGNMTPVIVVTGNGTQDVFRKTLIQDHFEFIEKPFDYDHLVNAIARALEKSKSPETVSENQESKDFVKKVAFSEVSIQIDKRLFNSLETYCEINSRSYRSLVEELISRFLTAEGVHTPTTVE